MIRNVGLMNQAPTEYEQAVRALNYEAHPENLTQRSGTLFHVFQSAKMDFTQDLGYFERL